jgi:hypothetical protein
LSTPGRSGASRTVRTTAELDRAFRNLDRGDRIRADGSDCVIAGNVVGRNAAFGVREASGADGSVFLGDPARDRQAWDRRGPASRRLGGSRAPARARDRRARG